ncbi:MAG TPA: EamA family transporter [Prevotella sp.]|nr:EamA family transporter [Prevotella sp.]
MTQDNNRIAAHSALLIANLIFGLGVPITKLLLDNWVSPMAWMATRCVGAAAIFWGISLFMPKEKVVARDLFVIMIGGLIGFLVSQTFTAWAIDYSTPTYVSLIATLTPVMTMACAMLLIGERCSWKGFAGIVVGIVGAMLMVVMNWQGGTGKNNVLGIAFALLSLLTWAIYLIITRKVSARYSAVTQMKWIFLVSAIAILPFSWSDLTHSTLYSPAWQWSGALEMAYIVVLATVVGFFAIPFASRYLKATTVSVYTNLQPIVAAIAAICLGQDRLTWDIPVALVLVLLSAYLVGKK